MAASLGRILRKDTSDDTSGVETSEWVRSPGPEAENSARDSQDEGIEVASKSSRGGSPDGARTVRVETSI